MDKKAVSYLLFGSIVYGAFVVVSKMGMQNVEAVPFAFASAFSSVLVVFAYYFIRKEERVKFRDIGKVTWVALIVIALSGSVLARYLYFTGLSLSTAINTGFLVKLSILFVLPIEFALFHKTLDRKQIAIALGMLLGVFLLVTGGSFVTPNLGDLMILMATVPIAAADTTAKWVMNRLGMPFTIAFRLGVGGLIFMGITGVLMGYSALNALYAVPFLAFGSGFLLSVAMISFYEGIELTTASLAASLLLMSSIFSALFAWIFLGESMGYFEGFGAILLVLSYVLMSRTSVHCH